MVGWLFARTTGRRFGLRMEDLDPDRVRAGYAERQQADLRALGLTFDGDVVWQSRRRTAYDAALETLADRTYECFCTRREIAEAASAPHGGVRHYPGTCRSLSEGERDRLRSRRWPALRLRADGARQGICDLVHGEVSGPVDDIVLRRNDGTPAYSLAVVVDDGAAGVNQVVRGEDLLDAAVSQAYLARQLGLPVPTYGHVPLAVNARGQRLAKRDGAVTLTDLSALGVSPAQALTRIAGSLNLAAPGEPVTLSLLADRFDPTALPREPWVVAP